MKPLTWSEYVAIGMALGCVQRLMHLPPYLSTWHINRIHKLATLRAALP